MASAVERGVGLLSESLGCQVPESLPLVLLGRSSGGCLTGPPHSWTTIKRNQLADGLSSDARDWPQGPPRLANS